MLAELALERARGSPGPLGRAPGGRGLRIVQVFMQGWIDSGLTRAGAGDAGGIATLLVHLGAALAGRPEVEEVHVTRAFAAAARPGARSGLPTVRGSSAYRSVATGRWRPPTRGPIGASSSAASSARSAGSARSTRSTCASRTWRASARRGSASGSGCRTSSRSRPTRTRSSAVASWRVGSTATASCRPTGASTCSSAPASSSACATARPASPCCPARELATSWPSSSGSTTATAWSAPCRRASRSRRSTRRRRPSRPARIRSPGNSRPPSTPCRRSDAASRSSSRSDGCIASRASRRSSRRGRATRRCAARRTSRSWAATSPTRAPRSGPCSTRSTPSATAIPARATGCCSSGTGRTATSCA